VVHYPLFARVGDSGFPAYSAAHSHLTRLVANPPMLVEAATVVTLLFFRPAALRASLAWVGLGLLAVVWLSTALLHVPPAPRSRARFRPAGAPHSRALQLGAHRRPEHPRSPRARNGGGGDGLNAVPCCSPTLNLRLVWRRVTKSGTYGL
jgi:hypothetical protein